MLMAVSLLTRDFTRFCEKKVNNFLLCPCGKGGADAVKKYLDIL
jgi:hypothetical protein